MTDTSIMQAIYLQAFGGPEQFIHGNLPRPQPAPGEVLVQVAYAGVNPADWKDREGYLAEFYQASFPYVIGFDAAGVIAAVGAGVSDFRVGERVFTASNHGKGYNGSYAQFVLATEDRLARVPDGLSLQQAAAIPVAALTGWQALFDAAKGDLQRGQRVLIHGGSGGLGSFAVQFARWAGAAVAATCSARNSDYVKQLGADCVIDYGQQSIASELLGWAPEGVDLIVDAVGCGTLPEPLELLKPGGKLVNIATLVGDGDIAADMEAAAARGMQKIFAVMDDEGSGATLAQIGALVSEGTVTMPPIQCFPADQVAEAHREVETGHVRGKLILAFAPELDNSRQR